MSEQPTNRRTKPPVNGARPTGNEDSQRLTDGDPNQRITALSEIVSRMSLATRLGQEYGGNRDIYEALGYKIYLTHHDFATQRSRQGIAKAVIDRPVNATWRGGVSLIETEEEDKTPLERGWRSLWKQLRLGNKLARLDRLTGIGQYGVLLLGFDDVRQEEDFATEVSSSGDRELRYVKPFGEDNAQINQWVTDPGDERYGMPFNYNIELITPNSTKKTLVVHHSRVIHVAPDLLESEIWGTPRLQAIYNRLKDLEKIVGGSAEMFWRGARPGYQGQVDPEYGMTPDVESGLQDQIDEFENNLRRILVNEGIEMKSLAPQVADPSSHVDVQIQMISAETGIPKRLLTGSEMGELASSEDRGNWLDLIAGRRSEFAEPSILIPFVERGFETGFLPRPQNEGELDEDRYHFRWADLFAPSEKEKAEVGQTRSNALKSYLANPGAQDVIPPRSFLRHFLGLDESQVEQIMSTLEETMAAEDAEIDEDESTGEEATQ